MNSKITSEHLCRGAAVYIRQSTPAQVLENTESQRRQYGLVDAARAAGFAFVSVIDDDLGRSGSGAAERPGFQKLAAAVCAGSVGAVFCIEASRLSRNGRDWHHLIDLCALAGTLVVDPDGVYDPRLINDRLLLGLKGTMSEYELSLLRQRGLAARDAKAARGELRFSLPPGYCWGMSGRIEIDPDERVAGAIRLVFEKFQDLGSIRQTYLWFLQSGVSLPVMRRNVGARWIEWRPAAYHTVHQVLKSPIYAGAYAFGRTCSQTRIVDGRARKTDGHKRAIADWGVLLHDSHEGYITWERFEKNQRVILENAHMKKRASRKAGRGGRALLAGLVRCGRCGRMMRVVYQAAYTSNPFRYQCRGDSNDPGLCIGIGGLRVDRAVSERILEAVSPHAVEAALNAAEQVERAAAEERRAVERELEEAEYEASLASRRHELVDPAKRHVARELEARWNTALEQVERTRQQLAMLDAERASLPRIEATALIDLAQDLAAVWNTPTTATGTKQRLIRVLVEEVVIGQDGEANEAVVVIHWVGGRHTEIRVPRIRTGRYPSDRRPSAAAVMRKLGGQWPDRDLAVTMNRMRCRTAGGETWTTVKVRELREQMGIAEFDPAAGPETISVGATARRLGICIASVHWLIRKGALPATQLMPCAPWQVPVQALESEEVQIGVREIVARRPGNFKVLQDLRTIRMLDV